jgi:hypothetical protein
VDKEDDKGAGGGGVIDDEEREAPVSDTGKSQHVHHPIFSSALR